MQVEPESLLSKSEGKSESNGALVSIVIPTYNRAHLIVKALNSVLSQTYRPIEIIVVDDGSIDESHTVINNWKLDNEDEDTKIYMIRQNNAGACSARNKGIEYARGEFIAFLDSDDEWLPQKLERQMERFESTSLPNVGVVTCGTYEVKGNEVKMWVPTVKGDALEDLLLHRRVGIGPPYLLCRREIFTEGGVLFDELLPARQDFDLAIQILQKYQIDFVPEPLLRIHHHSGDRVFTPHRALKASERLRVKYESLWGKNPRANAQFSLRLVWMSIAAGDWDTAKRESLRALRLRRGVLPFLWYTFARLGSASQTSTLQRSVLSLLIRLTFGKWHRPTWSLGHVLRRMRSR